MQDIIFGCKIHNVIIVYMYVKTKVKIPKIEDFFYRFAFTDKSTVTANNYNLSSVQGDNKTTSNIVSSFSDHGDNKTTSKINCNASDHGDNKTSSRNSYRSSPHHRYHLRLNMRNRTYLIMRQAKSNTHI